MLRGGPAPSLPAPRVGGSGRGALLDQIKGGASLKKVTPNERRQSSSDGRGDLLSEIRTGKQLKKVSTIENSGQFRVILQKIKNKQHHMVVEER